MRYHRLAVEGGSNLPREGPALILPKHCAYRDILLEGVLLYRFTRRYANYIMKVGLWGVPRVDGGGQSGETERHQADRRSGATPR